MKKIIWLCAFAFLIGAGITVFIATDGMATPTKPVKAKEKDEAVEKTWLVDVEAETSLPEEICDNGFSQHIPESEVSKEQMVEEIIVIWNQFFEDYSVPSTDIRRDSFEKMANDLADAVIMYQNVATESGGKLPIHPSTHKILATMVTYESSVTPNVRLGSSRDEAGPLQIHGKALAGYPKEVVRKNDRLGMRLGARWLANTVQECYPDGYEDWGGEMWLGPLSVYGAGTKGKKSDGTCRKIKPAKDRYKSYLSYDAFINIHHMIHEN